MTQKSDSVWAITQIKAAFSEPLTQIYCSLPTLIIQRATVNISPYASNNSEYFSQKRAHLQDTLNIVDLLRVPALLEKAGLSKNINMFFFLLEQQKTD